MKALEGFQIVHMSDNKNGDLLKEKRLVLKLTQQAVADKAKISLRQYQMFESDERNICNASFKIACRVIEALGMNISDFYHDKYVLGEEIYLDEEGLKYAKTGRLVSDDVEAGIQS